MAFEKAGAECVFSSEWDRFARETYSENFADTPAGDIRKIKSEEIPPHDILVAAGQLTLPKALEGRLEAYETLAEASEADRTYESVSSTLLALLAQPEGAPVNLVTSFSKPDKNTSNLTLNNLFPTATLGRPELISLEHEGEAARARIHQAEARRIPWFSFLQGNIEHDRRISSDSDQWGVLLGIDIPMWGHRADIQAATAEETQQANPRA